MSTSRWSPYPFFGEVWASELVDGTGRIALEFSIGQWAQGFLSSKVYPSWWGYGGSSHVTLTLLKNKDELEAATEFLKNQLKTANELCHPDDFRADFDATVAYAEGASLAYLSELRVQLEDTFQTSKPWLEKLHVNPIKSKKGRSPWRVRDRASL